MKKHYEAKDFRKRLAIRFYSTQHALLWHSLAGSFLWTVSTLHTFTVRTSDNSGWLSNLKDSTWSSRESRVACVADVWEREGLPISSLFFEHMAYRLPLSRIKYEVEEQDYTITDWLSRNENPGNREMPGIDFFFKITFNFLLQIVFSIHPRKMTMITKQKETVWTEFNCAQLLEAWLALTSV